MSTNEIKALELREAEMVKQLAAVRHLLHVARCEAAGVKEGDVVIDSKGRRFQVARVEYFWRQGNPTVKGRKALKGGGWHTRVQYVGTEWTKSAAPSE